jgi:dGTP triphosphohydrolase
MEYFLDHPAEMGQNAVVPAVAPADAAGGAGDLVAERLERIQAVTDYISGMTDRYAISRYRELFEPRSWAAP